MSSAQPLAHGFATFAREGVFRAGPFRRWRRVELQSEGSGQGLEVNQLDRGTRVRRPVPSLGMRKLRKVKRSIAPSSAARESVAGTVRSVTSSQDSLASDTTRSNALIFTGVNRKLVSMCRYGRCWPRAEGMRMIVVLNSHGFRPQLRSLPCVIRHRRHVAVVPHRDSIMMQRNVTLSMGLGGCLWMLLPCKLP